MLLNTEKLFSDDKCSRHTPFKVCKNPIPTSVNWIAQGRGHGRYITWLSMPSYPDCRAKPVSVDTPPWCRASWRRSGLSAHSKRGPLRRVADGSGPKTSLSHRLTIAEQRRCGEKQGSGRRLSRSSLHTSWPGWGSPRFRPGGKCSPLPGVPASVCPGRSPNTCSPSLRGQPGFVWITRRRME